MHLITASGAPLSGLICPGTESTSGASPARLREGAGLFLVLALAGLLRLGWPGVNAFGYDEALVSLLALRMARLGELARIGMQSSAGLPNFPATVWLFAIPFRLSSDPLFASLCVGLLNVLAVGGVWLLARRAWGPWAAFSAALVMAVSPYLVTYSRSIWSQNLLAPMAVLWAWAGVYGVSHRKSWAVALHAFLAGFLFQVHYAGIALIPASLWFVLRMRLWRCWRALAVGIALAILAALPFVYTMSRSTPTVRSGLAQVLQQPARLDLLAFQQWAQMAIGHGWERLVLGAEWRWGQPWLLMGNLAKGLVAILVGARLLCTLAEAWRTRRQSQHDTWQATLIALLPAWALSGPLVFALHSTPVHPQYQLAVLPALFLAVGALAGGRRSRAWGAGVATLVVIVALLQTPLVIESVRVTATRLTPGGIGTPLAFPRAVARALQDGAPIVVHAYDDQQEYNGDVAAFQVLLCDYAHAAVDGRSVILLRRAEDGAQRMHLLAPFDDIPALAEAQSLGLQGITRSFPRREGEPPYVALTLQGWEMRGWNNLSSVTLENGARLMGWRVRALGDTLRVSTWWQIMAAPAAQRYHQFHHLRDTADGPPLAVHDVSASSSAWELGDMVIVFADFVPPKGRYWIDVGMYTWPDIQRAAVLERPQDPYAPIRLGPFDWPLMGSE
jgi:4-amino-4-deoxy-L-arabinose transferase-like glycosyltransferase